MKTKMTPVAGAMAKITTGAIPRWLQQIWKGKPTANVIPLKQDPK